MNDKTLMLLTALASFLCAIWACYVPAMATAVALVFNAIISLILAFKIEKMS